LRGAGAQPEGQRQGGDGLAAVVDMQGGAGRQRSSVNLRLAPRVKKTSGAKPQLGFYAVPPQHQCHCKKKEDTQCDSLLCLVIVSRG
jgi:hypothetical protein